MAPKKDQPTWGQVLEIYNRIIDNSGYSLKTLAKQGDMSRAMLCKYLEGEKIPKKKTIARIEKIVNFARSSHRIERHPSFGYATPEQMRRLGGVSDRETAAGSPRPNSISN